MRRKYRARVLRVELSADEPTERWNLDYLGEVTLRVETHALHARCLESLRIFAVELVAVTVAFLYGVGAVDGADMAVSPQGADVGAQSHGATHAGEVLLVSHDVDDVVR